VRIERHRLHAPRGDAHALGGRVAAVAERTHNICLFQLSDRFLRVADKAAAHGVDDDAFALRTSTSHGDEFLRTRRAGNETLL
jgi:hypothetical protein